MIPQLGRGLAQVRRVIRDSGEAGGLFSQHGRGADVTRAHSRTPARGGMTGIGHATALTTLGHGDLAQPLPDGYLDTEA
jgi:hypothetical protein